MKTKEVFRQKLKNIKKFLQGKKIYLSSWIITGILLLTLIGLFVDKKDNYGQNIKTHSQNYSPYLKVIELVPQAVIKANHISEKNYYVQATGWYDWNDDKQYDKEHDIVAGVFYPLQTVRRVPREVDQTIFDFKHFHRKGYGWPEVPVKKQVTLTLVNQYNQLYQKTLAPGDLVELKQVYDAQEYDPEWGNIAQGDVALYLAHFDIDALKWNKRSQIPGNQPFGDILGEMAYDIERESDGYTPVFYPSDQAKATIDLLNAFGLMFLGSLTLAIFATVVHAIKAKNQKGLNN